MQTQKRYHSCLFLAVTVLLNGCPLPTDSTLEPEKIPVTSTSVQARSQSTLANVPPAADSVVELPTSIVPTAEIPAVLTAHMSTLAGIDDAGDADGEGDNASLAQPGHLKWAGNDTIYFIDTGNHRIRKLSLEANEVTTIAGSTSGSADGGKEDAKFSRPGGIAVGDEVIFVADTRNHLIRKVDLTKEDTDENFVTTLAGEGTAGFFDGDALDAQFNEPRGLALDEDRDLLFVADSGNHSIRRINLATMEVSTIAGDTPASEANEAESGFEDEVGTAARFLSPYDVGLSRAGDLLFVADYGNNRIRKIDIQTQTVTTLAGDGAEAFRDGRGREAQFRGPVALDVDFDGNVWVADRGNHRIRKVNPLGSVTTEVGTGAAGDLDGLISKATLKVPAGILAMNRLIYFTTDTKIKLVQFP